MCECLFVQGELLDSSDQCTIQGVSLRTPTVNSPAISLPVESAVCVYIADCADLEAKQIAKCLVI